MLEPIKKRLTEVHFDKTSGAATFSVPTESARATFDCLAPEHLGTPVKLARLGGAIEGLAAAGGGICLHSYHLPGESGLDTARMALLAGLKYKHLVRMENGYRPAVPERAAKLAAAAQCQWDTFASVKDFVRRSETSSQVVRLSFEFPDKFCSLFVWPAVARPHLESLSRLHVDRSYSIEQMMAASRGENGGWPALNLRINRLALGLSVRELSASAGTSSANIEALEAGQVAMSPTFAAKLDELMPSRRPIAGSATAFESDADSSCSSE